MSLLGKSHQRLEGSHRSAPAGARRLGDAPAKELVEVTVVLRRPDGAVEAEQADVDAVQRFADTAGLSVLGVHFKSRAVHLSGTVKKMNRAFGVRLGEYQHTGRIYRGREGAVHVPAELADTVVAVLGLDERAQARTYHRVAMRAQGTSYTPQAVAQRYGFPAGFDGSGQTVAIIELGGGYVQSDLTSYFGGMGLKVPSVTAVPVGRARNQPGSDADGEVALDIEVIGAVAQGATQLVFFAPNTDQGFYNAIAAALHDTRKPSVISISWGGPESSWTAQSMDAMDALIADAAALGVTVFAAAGDDGSTDGARSSQVDFPASSPNVVACGGTTLGASTEVVWNEQTSQEGATGGGVSQHFPLPAYQANANVPASPAGKAGRGVPDVAGNADPVTGYRIMLSGQLGVIGGTSAVAPLWAGLLAIANQANNTRAGDIHTAIYSNPAAFNDIVTGNNGAYQARTGWDACTGMGSPKGTQVVAALAGGTPGSGPVPTPGPSSDATALLNSLRTNLVAGTASIDAFLAANAQVPSDVPSRHHR